MQEPASGFDWDQGNLEKCQKHGVSIKEIEGLLVSDPRIAPDRKRSDREDRLIAVGRGVNGRPMFVAFTLRSVQGRTLVRPISARYMHAKEIEAYETSGP
jgi:uncharacterized DUF497 family protein